MNLTMEKAYLSVMMGMEAARCRSAKGCYDSFAKHYDRLFSDIQEHKAEILKAYMLESGIAGGMALDLGCGTGIMTTCLASTFKEVIGVDFSSNMLVAAKKRCHTFGNIEFKQADILNLSLPERSFEAITALGVMPHIPSAMAGPWAAQMKRLLTKRGHLILGISPAPWRMFMLKRPVNEPSFIDMPLFAVYNGFMRIFGIEAQCWYWRPGLLESILRKEGFAVRSALRDNLLIIDAALGKREGEPNE